MSADQTDGEAAGVVNNYHAWVSTLVGKQRRNQSGRRAGSDHQDDLVCRSPEPLEKTAHATGRRVGALQLGFRKLAAMRSAIRAPGWVTATTAVIGCVRRDPHSPWERVGVRALRCSPAAEGTRATLRPWLYDGSYKCERLSRVIQQVGVQRVSNHQQRLLGDTGGVRQINHIDECTADDLLILPGGAINNRRGRPWRVSAFDELRTALGSNAPLKNSANDAPCRPRSRKSSPSGSAPVRPAVRVMMIV